MSDYRPVPRVFSNKPFLHVDEVGDLLGLSERTVWRLLKAGKLPGTKLGGTWLISRRQLEEGIENEIAERGERQSGPVARARSKRRKPI
jgi:excisionase family DNA binding protein